MAYLLVEDFRTYSAGVDVSTIQDGQISTVLDSASALCDAYTNTTWGYQSVFQEPHDLNPLTGAVAWETYLYYTPVRTITAAFVSNSLNVNSSDFYRFNLPTGTTAGPSDLPAGQLPTNFGSIFLDRQRDIVSISYTALQFGLVGQVFPFTSFTHPQVFVSYTAGYDNGTVQPDGYTLPVPTWLKEATRLIAAAMLSESNLAAQGLSGIQQVRQGQTEFRRSSESGGNSSGDFTIPTEVVKLLRLHRRTSLV